MAVRASLQEARGLWTNAGIGVRSCNAAEQVLAEVLNNIVEHAQAGSIGGLIELDMQRTEDGLICNVLDNGAPMPGLKLPDGKLADWGGELDDLPEGGFGWFLIRSMTKDLRYVRRAGWNCLHFRVADWQDASFAAAPRVQCNSTATASDLLT